MNEPRPQYICAERMQAAFYGRPMQPILIRAPALTPSVISPQHARGTTTSIIRDFLPSFGLDTASRPRMISPRANCKISATRGL